LQGLTLPEYILLLDNKSIKIGDTAASYLYSLDAISEIVEAILNSKVRTRLGRMRALYVLNCEGRKALSQSTHAYLHLIHDRSLDVVYRALFGLVFSQNENVMDQIMAERSATENLKRRELFDRALLALKERSPHLFAPNFSDTNNVWELK